MSTSDVGLGGRIRFGLPFRASIDQTLLPFILPDGSIPGYVPIAKQTFLEGSNTSMVDIAPGVSVVTTSVTLPSSGRDGTGMRVEQYAAIFVAQEDVYKKPWLGLQDLIIPEDSGYYSWYSLPTTGMFHHFGRGTLLNALYTNMDTTPIPRQPDGTVPPVDPLLPLVWSATVNKAAITKLSFFDFDWYRLFEPKLSVEEKPNWTTPVLSVVGSPDGGAFKGALVKGESAVPGGAPMFNIVRVIKLKEPDLGTYTFSFMVRDSVSKLQKNCQLILTVS